MPPVPELQRMAGSRLCGTGDTAIQIAVVGHIRHPVSPPFMGGMESHCHTLVTALETRGHQVTLFAAGQSDLAALHPISAQPYEDVLPWARWRGTPELAAFQDRAFGRAWDAICGGKFDVVHNNALFPDLIGWAGRDNVPMVTSQHVPPFAAMKQAVDASSNVPSQQFTVTSRAQLALWATGRGHDGSAGNIRVVHNGIDLAAWRPCPDREDALLWYGRITPNKGLLETVAAARKAGVALDIVGTVEDRGYFERCMAGISGEPIRYLGHLTGTTLRERVAQAAAVVVTPMWDEPFGLVAAEALACDVPVIAFDRGALREVVGPCGALVRAGDVDALADAMARHDGLPATGNRDRAARLFSIDAMIDGYEACYEAAIAGSRLASGVLAGPCRASSQSSTAALLA